MGDQLKAGQQLTVNQELVASNNKTRLVMQSDGNLVLYRNSDNKALWASNTANKPVNRVVMQNDGNLVCYDAGGRAYWATGTDGHPGARLALQTDGNLVVYSTNNNPLWASNTATSWDPMTFDTGDVSVGTGEHMRSWASLASTGLISGHTHTWCTKELAGFHGSVIAVLLDASGKVIWPPNPQVTKHQYGVDGTVSGWFGGPSDRTDYWTNQVDPSVVSQAKSLALINFLDPKNMLLRDLGIAGKTIAEIVAAITAIEGL
jgi:hypothetical protein